MAEYSQKSSTLKGVVELYRDFIKDLRVELGETFSHNIPILPAQQDSPTRWFDIILRTNNHRIRLRIRRDNLYLDAYQMENSEGLKFGRTSLTSPHLIPGSTFLGYDGNYNALERASGKGMNNIALGRIALANAVNGLATSTISSANRARSLIIVIQMICESIRFTRISDLLAATLSNNSSSPPPD
ncbi:ribosome-inactivating protein charybdin-like [Camellia sinensis]|uniref:ribosome-inactivating protein charybdin-like n=1 Tax=Camellia sinensis TaxID=4442 RepID=UPI001035A0DD|nr:ribosome-inactivating protein charybdin-like [Camellia sinensis]